MKAFLRRVQGQLRELEERERRALAIGVVAVIASILYLGIYEPLYPDTEDRRQTLSERRQVLAEVRRIAPSLGVDTDRIAGGDAGSLMARIDGAAKQAGLAGAVRRMQPDGERVRIALSGAEFDSLVAWLGGLRSEHRVVVSELTLEPAEARGRVDGSLTLGPGA